MDSAGREKIAERISASRCFDEVLVGQQGVFRTEKTCQTVIGRFTDEIEGYSLDSISSGT